jgi:hypothetical protein
MLGSKERKGTVFLGHKTHRNYVINPSALRTTILENLRFRRKSQNLCNLWNSKPHYRIYHNPLWGPILSQLNPVHICKPCSLRFILTSISLLFRFLTGPKPQHFPTTMHYSSKLVIERIMRKTGCTLSMQSEWKTT